MNEHDFELRKQFCNSLTLLGAPPDVVQILRDTLDRPASKEAVQRIKNYNCELVTDHKRILHSLSTYQVTLRNTEGT